MYYMNLGSEYLARKLLGNRLAFISEAVNIKHWLIGRPVIEAKG